eukprot:429887-Amphidinium_carterae.1
MHEADALQGMSFVHRGAAFVSISRMHDEHSGFLTQESTPGLRSDGTKRGAYHSECDYQRTLAALQKNCVSVAWRRVEVKGARPGWSVTGRWEVYFCCIKPHLFDDLVLALYLPWGVELFQIDMHLIGLHRSGGLTNPTGFRLAYHAPKGMVCFAGAMNSLRNKLLAKSTSASTYTWTHPLLLQAVRKRLVLFVSN